MIYLKDKYLTDCLSLRETLYSKELASTLAKTDLDTASELKIVACKELGIEPKDYILDMKCGILFTREEQRKGIINLHKHE